MGLGVNAEITITRGLAVWTAKNGSLSWLVSALKLAGTTFMTLIVCPCTTEAFSVSATEVNKRTRMQELGRDFMVNVLLLLSLFKPAEVLKCSPKVAFAFAT